MKNPGHTSLGAAYREMATSAILTLAAGQAVDATMFLDARSIFWPMRQSFAGTPGFLSMGATVAGSPGSYTVLTDDVLDVSTLRTIIHHGGATQRIGAGYFNDKLSPHGGAGGTGAAGGVSDGYQADVVQLQDGFVTVANHYVPSGARFMLFPLVAQGTLGHLSLANIVPGNPGSFDIVSSNVLDTSSIQYAIIDPAAMASQNLVGCRDGNSAKILQVIRGTLVAGSLAFPATVDVASRVGMFAQRVTPGGALGHLRVSTQAVGDPGSITVQSNNAGDTSVVDVFYWNHIGMGASF